MSKIEPEMAATMDETPMGDNGLKAEHCRRNGCFFASFVNALLHKIIKRLERVKNEESI